MLVKVMAFASFREVIGKERDLEMVEGSTVADVLSLLALSDPLFRDLAFDSSGNLKDYVLLMVNKKRIDPLQDLSSPLTQGDELAIFPPVSGG